ncbi:MAG: BspA family leucine-rich repeat surface protein, partial [Ekhidna sp.]|nr:BspA family leucine-rich repeat surface protein [Ekhidna sp.]
MNTENTSYMPPKGLYEPNLMPPTPLPYFNISSIKSTIIALLVFLISLQGQAQEADPKPFITTWETTEPNETITIPTVSGETYSYSVNWGEDEPVDNNTYNGDASHQYVTPGTHTVTISGTFPRIRFGALNSFGGFVATAEAGQIRSVEKWGDNQWTSMELAFAGCRSLTIAEEAGSPNLSNVTDMSHMFSGAAAFNGDLSEWDVSKVTNMSSMFSRAAAFNGDLSEWNV